MTLRSAQFLLNTQPPAVTSYVNAIGLGEGYYQQALHWLESSAFSVALLCSPWAQWLSQHPNVYRLKGPRVYVGDGIKVAKEGCQMPGVTRLHQESEDVSKPEWIRGPYFNALSHDHQGVNSLAHSKSLQKQIGELGSQSSLEDFGFEPRTSSPRLKAEIQGIAPSICLILTGLGECTWG